MIRRMIVFLLKTLNSNILKIKYNVKINRKCNVSLGTKFEGNNVINMYTTLGNCEIGFGTYIGMNCMFLSTKIGKYCSIASSVQIVSGRHPTKNFVSTHPCFFSLRKQSGFTYVKDQIFKEIKYADSGNDYMVCIGNDVWIGANVSIIDGISIGDGAIIGANSLVTNNIENYGIYAGIPAKKIRSRFNESDIDFLLDFRWWEKEQNWIIDNAIYFADIEVFRDKMKN